jgi:hypothetical protein
VEVPGLTRRRLDLGRHATITHVGPYRKLHAAWSALIEGLQAGGHQPGWPQLEIYGHWTPDEAKLETTLVVPLG